MLFYPSLPQEMLEIDLQNIELYQIFGDMSMATFEGYMATSVFNFLSILICVYALANGTGTLAGEEDSGTLELLAVLPIPRWQRVLAKAVAMALAALIILTLTGLVIVAVFMAIRDQITTVVTAGDLFAMVLSHWPLALVFMMLSLFLGAFLPNRRVAVAVAAVALTVAFFGANLAGMVESLEAIRPLSPFYYFDASATALSEGQSPRNLFSLLSMAAVFLLLSILSFDRRDLTVGAWPILGKR
jgi:ABC-2 type transport system permease protein